MLYEIEGNPLLSGRAATLETEELEVYGQVAERVLGLVAPALEDEADAQTAANAVALQVSLLVALGTEIWYLKSESRGARSVTYRDEVNIHPLAARLIASLPATSWVDPVWDPSRWATVHTLRPLAEGPGDGWTRLVLTPTGDVIPEHSQG